MPSESGERRPARSCDHLGLQPPPVAENLQCPRCESTNTKFCYYNNYNMSQPRYFCKSCRRYWTQGGTLRNIPVGGGTRKHAKRSRTSSSASSATSSSSCSSLTTHDHEPAAVPVSFVKPDQVDSLMMMKNGVNLNENNAAASGGFSALLNSRGPAGFLALGGYGMGVGPMFDEMGYGLTTRGVGVWTFPHEVGGALGGNHGGGVVGCVGGGGDSSVASSGRNPFPMSGNDGGGWPDVDCFGWPDLAITMPGNGLK